MSNQAKPYEELDIYNSVNYPSSSVSATLLDFPVAQGTETLPYGVIWGDGTYQNSANPGGYSLTVQDGTTTVPNVSNITVTNGTLTNLGGGAVDIQTGGGGGGGVQNPMTSNLDGGTFDIFNITSITALNQATLPTIITDTINNSAPVKYYNQGAVAPGGTNLFFVADMDPKANGEAHCLVISRCLDPGLKQTTVFSISSFAGRSSIDVHMNLTESDTPIFDAVVIGDNGGTQMYASMQCVSPSNTWELRVYQQQDNKGTGTGYGTPWNIITPSTPAPVPISLYATALLVSVNPYGSKTFTGSQVTNGSISSDSLSTTNQIAAGTTINAGTTVTAGTNLFAGTAVYTNEIRDNGFAPIGVYNSISLQNNDIQSVNTIGCNIVGGPITAPWLKIGHPVNGPLYVDGINRRVGIGVPIPTEDLEIDGNIQLDTGTIANSIKFYDTAGSHDHAWITAQGSLTNGGELVIRTKQDGSTLQDRLTVKQDGVVVITSRVEGLQNPINATDAANKQYVDSSIPSLAGYVQNPMTGDLDAGTFRITNLSNPTAAQDAATKDYVDTSIGTGYVTNPMVANLDGGGFNLFNINQLTTNNRILAGAYIETFDSVYAGQALTSPLQGFCQMMLPEQFGTNSGVMPTWTNGYLDPQKISSRVAVTETVTAPGANKLNASSLILSTIGAYTLLSYPGGPGTNVIITVPPQLDNHIFNVQVDGEWNGSTIGGNGNSYMFIREDANPAGTIYGMTTGQAIDGARYPCCLNFTGALPQGDYAILTGHYDLGSSRDYNGSLRVAYIGHFSG